MARYSNPVYTEQTNPNVPPVPIVGASVTVVGSNGTPPVLTDDNGNVLQQPLLSGFNGSLSFNIPDPGDICTLQFRYRGKLIRKVDAVIGKPLALTGPAGRDNLTLAWEQDFSAVAGQTTFNTTRTFAANAVAVYLNTGLLPQTAYTMPTNQQIVLNEAITNPGFVIVKAYDPVAGAAATIPNADVIPFSGGTGATTRPLGDILRERSINAMDWIPQELRADVEASNSTTVDHWSYIMQAAAYAGKRKLMLPPGIANIGKELDLGGLRVGGHGLYTSALKALAPMRSMIRLSGQNIFVEDFALYGEYLPQSSLFCEGINGSTIERVYMEKTSINNVCFPEGVTNNTDTRVANCLMRTAGRRVSVGTVTCPAGFAGQAITVTLTGYNQSTLANLGAGAVRGYDWLKIGSLPIFEIQQFDATNGTAIIYLDQNIPAQTNAPARVYQGSAIEIQRNGNSSKLQIVMNEIQFPVVAGIDCCSLYGMNSYGNTAEITGIPIVIGRRVGGGESQPINWSDENLYAENYSEGGIYYIGSQREGNIINPMADTAPNSGMDMIRIADPNITLRTLNFMVEGVQYNRRYEKTNESQVTLRPGDHYEFTQGTTASDLVVNLYVPPATSNGRRTLPYMSADIIIDVGDIGGKLLTIQSADGTTLINSLDANSTPDHIMGPSITWRGNYRRIVCTWSNYGWRVFGTTRIPYSVFKTGPANVQSGNSYSLSFSSTDFGGADLTKLPLTVDAFGYDTNGKCIALPIWEYTTRTATQLTITAYNDRANGARYTAPPTQTLVTTFIGVRG